MVRKDFLDRLDKKFAAQGVRIKDADQWKVFQDIFDEATLLALYRLASKKQITSIGGVVSTGKEGNVLYGERDAEAIAIKVYLIQTANFRAMTDYLDGDPRFSHVRRTRKEIIFAWTRKEYSNLKRAYGAGIPVPEPYIFERNILLMRFLGEDGRPYPQLRHVRLQNPEEVYRLILGHMEGLFQNAKLVHADLSEYNILMGPAPYIIDMGQSVTPDHPRALQFLVRDIANINRFFKGKCHVMEEREIFDRITKKIRQSP